MSGVSPRTKTIGREAGCLAAYAAAAACATYPLVLRFTTAIPGYGDAYQFLWNLWWVKRALVDRHESPLVIGDVHFPYGSHLYFHTLNLLQDVMALPITILAGLPAAYNFLVVLSFTLSGYAMYRLSRYVLDHDVDRDCSAAQDGRARLAAFVAGMAFTLSSYRFVHLLGHLDLLSTQWLPFTALFLLKARRETSWRNSLYLGAFLAATTLTSSYYASYMLVFVGLVVTHVVARRDDGWRGALGRIAAAVGVFALLVSPVLMPMLALGRTQGRTPNPGYDVDRFSADGLAFVMPSSLHPLWGRSVAPVYDIIARNGAGLEAIVFLGGVALLLAICGLKRMHRRVWTFWLVGCLVFGALALGPVLHLGGSALAPSLSALMPYRLFARLPYGDIPRVPARFVVMAMLCLSVLAALGAWSLLRSLTMPRAAAATVALTATIGFENAVVPLRLTDVQVPPYFDRLARETGREGVIEVPIPDDPAEFPRRMLWQAVHGQPVYGGYLSRGLPPLAFDAIPGFAQFKTLSADIDDIVRYDARELPAISRGIFAAYRAGRIVIEKPLMTAEAAARARALADSLVGSSAREYEDESTLAYVIRPAGERFVPAPWLDTGWSYIERLEAGDAAGRALRWRWMGERARIGIITSDSARVHLSFTAQALGRPRRLRLAIGESEIATLTVTPERTVYETPEFTAAAGSTFVEWTSLDGADSPGTDPRRLSVALFTLQVVR
jgi:hypothetical protein